MKDAADYTFGSVQGDARPDAELLYFTALCSEVFRSVGEDRCVVRVAQAAGVMFVDLIGGEGRCFVSPSSGSDPSVKGL